MSILKKWGLVKEDIPTPTPVQTQPSAPSPTAIPSAWTVKPIETAIGSATDYNSHFDEIISKANIPKPGYPEFSAALKNLSGLTDEQKYVTIFSIFSAQGITANKLIDSAKSVSSPLDNDKTEFDNGVRASRKETVEDIAVEIENKKKEVENLTLKIKETNEEIERLKSGKDTAERQLAMEETNYKNTFAQRIMLITEHIGQIQTYLLKNAATIK